MSFGNHFGQPVPITTHQSVRDNLTHETMGGNWHVLAEMATKTDLS
jgi:hypothetical protein